MLLFENECVRISTLEKGDLKNEYLELYQKGFLIFSKVF